MSADNWAVCPQCKKKLEVEQEKRIRAPGENYGKVSKEEYERILQLAQQKLPETETLREDYEISVNAAGLFYVSYGCSCDVCGFEHEFKTEKQLDLKIPKPKE
jgi:uncharacterized protein YbaR (Trm112 family)